MSDSRLVDEPHPDLTARCERLEREIARLRSLLDLHGIAIPPAELSPPKVPPPISRLKTPEKIALFRSLFRGREDVYARRWESPDGRSGYAPNAERDWKAYYAAKPEDRKRVDKGTKKNIQLDDEAIHNHLAGKHTSRGAVGTPVDPTPPAQIRTCRIAAYGSYLR